MKDLIVFDLDGTLFNTIGGIANSVNMTRKEFQLPELPEQTVVSYVGNGILKLTERSFQGTGIDTETACRRMKEIYAEHPVVKTEPYPGVTEGLQKLHEQGWTLCLLTNKPTLVAEKILVHFKVDRFFTEMIGGGSAFPLKPDPAAVVYLLEKYHCDPKHSWILGDNYTDTDTAINAGISGAFARYGFGKLGDSHADLYVDSFQEFTEYLPGETK